MSQVSDMSLDERATYKYLLADYHNKLGQSQSAYNSLNEHVALMDSINQNRMDAALQEIEKKYDKQTLEREFALFRRYNAYRIIIGLASNYDSLEDYLSQTIADLKAGKITICGVSN